MLPAGHVSAVSSRIRYNDIKLGRLASPSAAIQLCEAGKQSYVWSDLRSQVIILDNFEQLRT